MRVALGYSRERINIVPTHAHTAVRHTWARSSAG
jgi:hypothetical protein